jgi:spermidine synthase
MSASYKHPKVKVHIGDGFKFLDDYKNEFDVIITDSSDPVGPAESLFQKSYFNLLFGALKEDGIITTQGQFLSYVKFHSATLHLATKSLLVSPHPLPPLVP